MRLFKSSGPFLAPSKCSASGSCFLGGLLTCPLFTAGEMRPREGTADWTLGPRLPGFKARASDHAQRPYLPKEFSHPAMSFSHHLQEAVRMGMAPFPSWEAEAQRGQDPHPPLRASLRLLPTRKRPEVNQVRGTSRYPGSEWVHQAPRKEA